MYFNRKNAEQKNWRMIKKGKHFLFGCSLVFAVGATLATPTVQADTAEAKVDATVGTAQAEPTAEAPTYAAPAATSPVATEAVEANSATTAVSVDKSQLEAVLAQAKAKSLDGQEASVKAEVATAIAEAEALVANGSASQEQVNQSVERLTQAVASVKEVTEAAIEKTSEATTESSATPKVRSRRATTEGTTRSIDETNLARAIVTKENFESFFQEVGTASYEKSSGTIKLTEDVSGQAGNAYLRFKIDPSQDFSFTGKVDIGNKYEGHEVDGRAGGDGVGFVFHTGKQSQLGLSGASIGMGGINAAFGFKLDSWWNKGTPKPEIKSMADPSYNRGDTNHAFGAFYSSNNQGRVNSITEMKPLNPAPNGQWVDFKINYNGTKKEFTVTYGSQTWTTKLDKSSRSMTNEAKNALTARNATYALSFVGSTGSGTNLQRVQIEKFEFTAPQIVHMKFVDESGQEIEASSAIPGDENEVINLSTQDKKIAAVEAKGYTLKEIDSSKAPSYIKENNTVTLTPGGQLLTYVFKVKDTTPPAAPTVNSVTAGATAVTGTAEAGSTVEVTLPGGSKVSAKADQDGSYSVPVSALKEGDTVSVTATDDAGNKSTPTSVTVPDKTAPAAPTVNPVKAGATAITGTAEAGSTVEVTLQDGQKSSAKAGENGEFSIPVPALNADDQISVTATDVAKNTSTPTKVTVKETVRPTLHIPYDDPATQAIYVYSGEENNIELKVTDNSGKIVKAYLALPQDNRSGLGAEDTTFLNGRTKGGLYLKTEGIHVETTATESTPAIVRVTGEVPKNTYTESSGQFTRYLFAEDAAGNTGYEHVGDATTPGQLGRIRFMWKPQTFKYTAVAPSTPITSNTVPEASAIEKAVKDANPTFSDKIGSVTLDGTNVNVTYKDGSTDVIPASSVFTIKPTAPTVTPVKNTSALTTPEKQAVEAAVRTANPDATTVVVGNDGSTTLTYSNGSTAKLTPAQTVKAADSKGVQEPAAKTPVQNTSALTQPEKDAVKKAVETANPTATKVEVGDNGDTTVTFPDGTTATLPGDKTVKVADSKGVQDPAAKTPVQNTSALTQPEKDAVKKAVETANPTATKVEVGDNGDTTVTFPDGTTATLPGDKTVKVADSKGVQDPAAKTPVQNTSALTQPEKDAVKKAVETANPTATKVEVGDNGDTTVTFPDGTTATLPGDKTVKVADSKGVQDPAAKTPVQNTSALTQPEKDAVKKAVETANPTATKVEVGDNGDTTVTFPDGTTATLPGDKTVKVADSKGVQDPAAKTPVQNTSALTQPEKDAVKKAVETANPTATKVEVGDNGDTTVTFPDGTTATLPGDKTVKVADSKGVQDPAAKTPVQNTSALTQPEKDAVKKAVETANPTATKVEVGDNGDTTVTFPDGTTATLPGDKTVKVADSKGVQDPAAKTPVQNTSALTQPEKDAVKKAVETANPTATKVEVGDNGDTTVTFPDGTTATLPGDKTVKVADSKGVQDPAAKTPVQNTSALTQPEKDAVKKAVETANPTATKVEVGDNGDTTVTFPDGTTATLPGDKTVKVADSKGVQDPAAKTPVQNTSALTQPEKDAVKKAVETANPTATKVEVGDNGDTTVTFPDGTTATLPGDKTVKVADSKGVQDPAAKTPVQNTSALTQPEKDAVKKAVETANPTATKVEVGDNGDTTVTFPDGTTATLPGDKTVKVADSKGVQDPAAKTPVQNTSALTQPEKDAVKKAVETANPTATKVEVGDNGDTTVTFPDGTTATLPGDKTVKVADSKGVQDPAAKTPVQNTSALTQPEKDAVKKAVETANPTATKVEVGDNGDTTVTFPDGTTATLPGDKTVKVADSKGVQDPAAKTPVQNTSALTQPEKDAVKKAVETANPTATKVEVGDNGDTTVTFPDGTTATLPGDKTVKVADSKGVQDPAAKTPVQNTSALTQPEKDAVKKAVETANPTATKVEVGDNGDTTVTFPDGTTATLPGDKTVKVADSKGVQDPAAKTPVQNTSALTQPEKDAVKKAVETANPTATKVEVGDNGDTTVTFPDGTTATLPGDKTVKVADSKGVQDPAAKTPVQNTSALTQPEKDAVKKAVETANPTATKVEVGDNGDTTVTFPDGTTATLPGDKTVKVADSKGVQDPAAKTPVQNTSALTQPEKDAVKKAVETANPTATKVEVGDNGDTTVTFPDGTTATLPGDKTVKVADSKGVQDPAAKTPVQNTSALTQPEKDAVKKAVETANPTATKVEVGDNGDTTVTFPDGTTATLPGDKTVKVADSKGVQEPAAKTPVQNTSALTQPEKDAVKKAVETANPTATKVEVGDNGDTTVTFPDGTTATLPGDKTVKVADSKGVQEPAAKTPVQNTSALTQPEKDAVKKAVETANPTATKVEVGDNGDTTVTFPDGTTATLPGDKTVKVADSKGVQDPAAKTPVQNTSALTQPEKDAVKKAVETANPTATKVEVGDNGDTTVTFPDGTTATLTGDKTVKEADDKTAPDAPVVNPVKAGDTAVTGTAEAGSTVEVTLPDGTKASATADQDGNFSVPVSGLEAGQTVSVTAKDASNNTSTPTTATVAKADDKTAPDAPVVNPVKAGDTAVTGTAEAGSTVEVTLPDGTKASATADQDGNFSVPVSGLEAGQTVSVTAKDASNNTSTPTTATVAKADDKTAPDAPVVNPVKAGDTAVTGTAEAGSTVEVTLPDGTKASATADQDGNFSVPVSGLEAGQTVSVTAKDASNNTSTPTTATVAKADDKTAPDAPVVNPVKAGDTAVTGTAEAGSTVEVTLPDGTKASATADQDGNFSVPVSGLEAGQTVSVTAKDASNNTSTPTTATVAKADDKTAPDAPVVNPVKAGDTAVTGTAEAGSTVEVTLPDGTKASATADQDGNFSVPVSGLEEGQTVSVTAKDASNNTSTPTTATVAKADDKTAPDAPVVNPVKAGDTAVTGTAEAGSTVEVTLPDGTKASATADQDGNFSVPVSGLEEGQTVSVTAKDASNNTSTPTTATVAKADDKTAPDAPVVNPVKAGDTAVTGTAEAGSTVEVTLPDGTKASATADQDGNFSVPVSGLEEGQTVSVTAKDASNNTSTPTTATVAKADDKTAPDAPVVNPVKAGDTAVTGTAEAGSTVEVTLPDGTKASATADQDGNFSVPVSGLEAGQTVSVTAKDASNNTSTPTTATVAKADDKTAPDAPVVNPVKAGDTAVTGTAEAGSTVEVTLPDGTKASATADQDGNFSVPVSGLEEGQTVSVTAKDASNNTSTPTTATVAKADDKTAPDAPVVNPVKAGDTAVTGTAEAGSTVEVTLPDGTKASATADQDGNFSVPVSGLEEGQTVSVTAKDASNNTSTPTTATVAKADDKTAPDAPVVNPVKAGDTAVTGTAEAGSTVEVTLPDGTKASATADQDGNFSVPVSGLEEGQTVSVTAKDASNNTSTPTTATVAKADDKTAPDAPVVNPVKEGDKAVTGTAEPGLIVEITLPNSETVTVATNEAGIFYLPVMGLKAGDKVTAVSKDASGNASTPTEKTVGKRDVKDADGIQAPSTKTPVKDTANLTDAEKAKVKEAVEAANPGSKAEVGQDGTTTVTFPDGSTATLTGDQTVKTADANGVQAPTTKTPVKDTANLTDAEKAKVKEAVEAANPGSKAEVDQDGTTKVTFPDGSTATLTGAQTVKEADSTGVQAPGTKTPVQNTSALTQPEKEAVKKAVEDANPTATKVKVGNDGSATVTFPDGSTATLTGDQTVKTADANGVQAPTTKTPVKDTANLTDAEKAKVKEAVEAANPGSKAEVGQDGTTKVTFPDGSTATLTGAQTVKEADSTGVQAPGTKTPVQNTSALTQPEKDAVKKAVEDANPTATKVKVGNDGSATVTFPDGSTATLTGAQTVKEADSKGIQAPSTKTPVKDTANLTDAEKAKVKEAVEAANPGSKAEVGQDGTTTVTFPDGSTATLTGDQTVKTADANGVQAPTTKTPVKDTANLTDAEKAKVKEAVEAANPGSKAEVDQDGTTKVTFPDGSTATLTGAQTVKEADSTGVQAPGTKTPVQNTSALTQPEKEAVKKAVEDANPTATKVKVGNDGSATVTFPDGSTATLTGDQTVKTADANGVQAPTTKTPVKDTANLTDAEKAKVKEAVEAANPGSKAEVGQDGTTKVTFPDGSTATLTGAQTVKEADSTGVQAPGTKTPVQNTSALTQPEKDAVKKAVEDANPTATKVKVGNDGSATVTFPDGSTATLTGAQTVKEADSKGVQAPSTKTPVKDTANLTDAEKAKVKEAVEAANPGSKAEVGQDGTTTVTFPDGSTATLTGDKTVTQADITAPTAPVVNPVKAGDTAVTGTAEAGSTVEVTLPDGTKVSAKADKDGKFSIPVNGLNAGDTVSVTATDEAGNTSATTTVTVSNVNVGGKEADNAKVPALTPVVAPNNLTDAEKAKVAEEVKKANPTATDVKVNNDGSVVVTFADGSVATIAANKVVKEATKESSAQAPAKKAGAKELPNTGTKQSNASLGLALLAAVTGGLLISKKRKEEE